MNGKERLVFFFPIIALPYQSDTLFTIYLVFALLIGVIDVTQLDTVKNRIAELLETHEHLRNDDIELIFVYWRQYDDFDVEQPDKPITSPETIRRARQKLQAEGYFRATDPKVIRRRRQREEEIRDWAIT